MGFSSCQHGDGRRVAGVLVGGVLVEGVLVDGVLRQLQGQAPAGRFQAGNGWPFTLGELGGSVGGAGEWLGCLTTD